MTRRLLIAIAGTVLWLGWSSGGARAQTPPPSTQSPPPTTQPPPPAHHSQSGSRHARSTAGSITPIPGGIIGNKNSHVYHLPGDKGKLPAEKNRVYFHSEAE